MYNKKTVEMFEKIKNLHIPKHQYVVVGSSILQIKGIRESMDIDILLPKYIFENFKKIPGWNQVDRLGPHNQEWNFIENNGIQLYYFFYGARIYDYEYYIENASRIELIEDMYFSSLTELLRAKKEWNREKDMHDISLMEEYLHNI